MEYVSTNTSDQKNQHRIDCCDDSTTADEMSDEGSEVELQNELFLEEYFHQQYLKMQAIYPPSFKSKVKFTHHELEAKFSGDTSPSSSSVRFFNEKERVCLKNCQEKVTGEGLQKNNNRKHGALSGLIMDNLEKLLVIVCFESKKPTN